MKCVNCGSKEIVLIVGGNGITSFDYKNMPTKPALGDEILKTSTIDILADSYFCSECGFVSEFVKEKSLKDFIDTKKYITNLE